MVSIRFGGGREGKIDGKELIDSDQGLTIPPSCAPNKQSFFQMY